MLLRTPFRCSDGALGQRSSTLTALAQQLEPHIPALAGRVQTMAARGTLREMQRCTALRCSWPSRTRFPTSTPRRARGSDQCRCAGDRGSEDVKTFLSRRRVSSRAWPVSAAASRCAAVPAVHATMTRVANTLTLQSIVAASNPHPQHLVAGGASAVAPPPQSGIAAQLLSPLDAVRSPVVSTLPPI